MNSIPRGACISFTQAGAVQDAMDKTRTDNEAGNSKDATVVEPEVNVSCV